MVDRELLMQAGASAEDVERLDRAWSALQTTTARDASHTPCVVCTGIYNAGKSTLLNALMGRDIFPTGDIPTTKAVARAEYGGAVYIDTPGLNAEDEDDQETLAAYESADFILFVSNAQNGGISAAEAGWLKKLGERWTADSLKQRLIYVLSHSAQVEPEELPGIEARVHGDLERAVGFVRERIFCVDSILFQQGREQEETVLVESSGIPQLQAYLSEQIAGAEDTLCKAYEVELAQRRQELSEALDEIRLTVQQVYDAEYGQTQKQIAAVDAMWEEFEEALSGAMPIQKIAPISCYVSLPSCSINVEDQRESIVKRKMEERLKSVYDKRDRIVRDEIRKQVQGIKSRYCIAGLDSAYASCCNQIVQVFNENILAFQKLGLSVTGIDEFSVAPDLPSDLSGQIERELLDDVVRYDGYYSLREYVDVYGETTSYTKYVSGLFGIDREVEVYRAYSAYSIIGEMEKDIQRTLDINVSSANGTLNGYWQDFLKKLNLETDRRKSALRAQVDAYKENLGSISPDTEKTLAHLLALKEAAPL